MAIKLMRLVDGSCVCPACLHGCNVKIDGYSDSFFAACSVCQNSGALAWPGTFTLLNPGGELCSASSGSFSINGKILGAAFIAGIPSGGPQLFIQCVGEFPASPVQTVWQSNIMSGFTPGDVTGVYTRQMGCDTTPAITIVKM